VQCEEPAYFFFFLAALFFFAPPFFLVAIVLFSLFPFSWNAILEKPQLMNV